MYACDGLWAVCGDPGGSRSRCTAMAAPAAGPAVTEVAAHVNQQPRLGCQQLDMGHLVTVTLRQIAPLGVGLSSGQPSLHGASSWFHVCNDPAQESCMQARYKCNSKVPQNGPCKLTSAQLSQHYLMHDNLKSWPVLTTVKQRYRC